MGDNSALSSRGSYVNLKIIAQHGFATRYQQKKWAAMPIVRFSQHFHGAENVRGAADEACFFLNLFS